MEFLDLTLPTIAENLALDEALLLEAEAGRQGEVLRLWESSTHTVVLGAGCRLSEDVDEAACVKDGVPIQRRSSGGGTVLLGPGCLLFSLILRYDRDPALGQINSSYAYILERIGAALTDVLPGIEHAGTSDLAADGRKFSGNSQQRKRTHLLHHGTLLHGFAIERISRYLRTPARQPEYRHGREHGAFVRNLSGTAEDLKRRLRTAWAATEVRTQWPIAVVDQLVHSRYTQPEWVRRR